MKHIYLIAVCMVMSSCVNSIHGYEDAEKTELKFSVKYDVSSFNTLKTRAGLNGACSSLKYYNYDSSGELENSLSQESASSGFGSIKDKVSLGSHDFYFVGTSATDCTFDYSTGLLSFNKVTDTFVSHLSLTVEKGTAAPAISLNRVTALIQVLATDAIPTDAKIIRMVASGYPNQYNIKTDAGQVEGTSYTHDIAIPSSYIGVANVPFRLYAFVPSEGYTCNMSIQVLNSAGMIIYEHSLPDVPIYKNKITQYCGDVFSNKVDESFLISAITQYSDTINYSF